VGSEVTGGLWLLEMTLRGYCSGEAELGGVIPTPNTENSLLLTANLLLLCSTAHWVFQRQSGASRLLLGFFPPF